MELRDAKPDDQDQAEKAFKILKESVDRHPEIEPNIWMAAYWSILVDNYIDSGIKYEQFCQELANVRENYRSWFASSTYLKQFFEEDESNTTK